MLVTSVTGSVDLGVVFGTVTAGASVTLPLVGDSVTRLFNECDMCVLLGTGGAAVVGADLLLVVNCGVGAGAAEEKRHGMSKLT